MTKEAAEDKECFRRRDIPRRINVGDATRVLGEPSYHAATHLAVPFLPRHHDAEPLSRTELRSDASAEAVQLKGLPVL